MNNDSERMFIFAIHDLLELIECNQIDGSMVVSALKRGLRQHDRWLDISDAVIAAQKAEERYFNEK